ncbi:hypothetical protein CDL12_12500 [Handroanthus impetiginosus]|uniref:Transcription repressor n=1 Tax=Handroanthus impetiginosus TaxID=429701 RepID=A0A2G9HC22_9LAMI|nr:hypothetical protein CDL12_12500 [Handroanthus impetiginosus]
MIIRGVRLSERLFFEPGETSSILKETKTEDTNVVYSLLPFKESVVLALESEDPYLDFKKSMQEMVESHGIKEWEGLEELLGWYLKMNGKNNHRFIVGAFVDMLVDNIKATAAAGAPSSIEVCCSDETSYSSADSCFSCPSSPVSPTGVQS